MNAIELLKEDHDRVRELLARLVDTSPEAVDQRPDLLQTIEQELKIHTQLEEEIFYPAFKEADGKENERMYFEAKEEHRAVESLVLPDLKQTEPGNTSFSGRAKVLKELVEHHAQEEEEEMFERARECLSEDDLAQLGERMRARKEELQQSM
jgi:iron-sulfur cluster repair protein YtfE (RIC family)